MVSQNDNPYNQVIPQPPVLIRQTCEDVTEEDIPPTCEDFTDEDNPIPLLIRQSCEEHRGNHQSIVDIPSRKQETTKSCDNQK